MYKWAAGFELQPTGEFDFQGKPIMTRVQRNPQLAKKLGAELGYETAEPQQPQPQTSAQDEEAGYIAEAIQNNVPPAQIAQGIRARAPELEAKGVNVNALLAMVEQQQPQAIRPDGMFYGTD